MTGKEKCELLRSIRREIAERNGIEYLSADCHHEGDCLGTCPKCDAEARYLNSELERLVREGRSVDFIGGVTEMYERVIEEYQEKSTNYASICDDIDDDDLEDENNKITSMGELRMGDDRGRDKNLEITIEELDLSVRTFNCLKRAGINTVEDMISLSCEDMMRVRNLGKRSFDEVISKLAELGYELSHDDDYEGDESFENETNNNIDPSEMTLEDLDLSVRTFNYLKRRGINTVKDLVNYDESEHFVMGSISPRPDMNEVKEKLAELGLSMKNDEYYE